MTDDTISRQAAIDILAAMQGRCTSKAALIQNSKIWQQIKQLPSASPRWIPMSERLPKEDENVLAWVKEEDACGDNVIIAAWSWHDMEDSFFNKIGTRRVWHTDQYYYEFDEIAAWMPLPEPWEGANDDQC